jgi:signal transduction histidine kinase/DNA-binding response OmpR family regulator
VTEPLEPPAAVPEDAQPRLRILVVDDDRVDRMAIRRALLRAGVDAAVDEAEAVPQALALAVAGGYDCVFLDYNLPGGNGLTLLRSIRAAGVDAPVVMLTGQGDERVAVALMKAGAADYLPKDGITPERLAASLRYAVELKRAEAETQAAQEALRESAERTRFLAEASRVLADSLDMNSTLRAVARLAVPLLGDYCVIYLTQENGEHRGVAAAHADPEKEPLVRALERHYRPTRDHPTSYVADAIRSGEVRQVAMVPDEHLATLARTPEELEVFRALQSQAGLFVPLAARGHVLGAIGLLRTTPGSVYTPAQVALAEDLARRAAVAIDNARLFEDAAQARAAAEEANRAKSEFLARMSHDLRTPLNAIGGYAQLVEMGVQGPVTELQREAMGRIVRAQEHLLTLINDILSFARLEAGQVQIEIAEVPLRETVDELRPLVQPLFAARGVALELRPPDPALRVLADGERLIQVCLNLLTNAAKFTDSGGRVVLDCVASEGTVAIRVSDTGRGIPPERIEAIFNPFIQAGNSDAETRQGVGLGLAISRELLRLMNGTLTVESVVGEGTTFIVQLARAPGALTPPAPLTG